MTRGKADTDNAQIRKTTRREAPDVKAEEAQRLLDDPAFIRGFDAVRNGVIKEIENLKHDGQPETENYELELCRTLRNLKAIKRSISLGIQGQKLRLAAFKPSGPESDTEELENVS